MDWIQIYLLIMLVVSAVLTMTKHGEPRENHNFWVWLLSLAMGIPWIGRVFGWW